MTDKRCPVCGNLISGNYPFHKHMQYHERRGEVKAIVRSMGGPTEWIVREPGDKVEDLPLFKNQEADNDR